MSEKVTKYHIQIPFYEVVRIADINDFTSEIIGQSLHKDIIDAFNWVYSHKPKPTVHYRIRLYDGEEILEEWNIDDLMFSEPTYREFY